LNAALAWCAEDQRRCEEWVRERRLFSQPAAAYDRLVRLRWPASMLVTLGVGFALALGAPTETDPGTRARGSGVLRVITSLDIGSLDPALAQSGGLAWALEHGTCGTLMSFRDGNGPDGSQVQPDAAVAPPTVSRDLLTYVFTVRPGLRFSDGRRLTAANFRVALSRVLNPVMRSYGGFLFSDVRRVSAHGRRLRIQLRQPAGDLVVRMALPYACPVPIGFPVNPAGVPLMVGSGPYYVASHTPGRQLVIERNRYYKGPRPARIGALLVTFAGGSIEDSIRAVEEGRADVLGVMIPPELRPGLAARYGVNKKGGQLFRLNGTFPYPLVLNTSRPLFRNNVALRQAVNFALARADIVRAAEGGSISSRATDQILSPVVPGWVDYRLYPLTGPNLRRARALADGNTRGGKAVLYVFGIPALLDRAQVIVRNLREIGLDVTVKPFSPVVLDAKAGTPGEPYDMLLTRYRVDYPDPANLILRLLGGANARKPSGNTNAAYFDNPAYDRRMAAANRLFGSARVRAFSKLEADIMRNQAPWAPMFEGSSWLFVSKRVGCFRLHPVYILDYPAVCLR
jgi:peptide/nickel transport system substrate-binding protein